MTGGRLSRSTWLRFGVWLFLVATAFVLVRWTPLGEAFDDEHLASFVAGVRGTPWAPFALVGLYGVLAPLGLLMSPLIVAGAALGAVRGTVCNSAGMVLGAATSFLVARYAGRDFVVRVAGPRLRRAERRLGRLGFWPLVQTRFLPLPYPVVNFGAALAGVGMPLFLSTSAVGLVLSTLIHTVFIAGIFEARGDARWTTGAAYALVLVAANVVLGIPTLRRRRHRRRRYRRLLAERAARAAGQVPGESGP